MSLRDLQWRRRRFVIAVLATALVFSMTLLMSGVSAALHHQDRTIVESFGADAWLVAAGAAGPFTSTTPIPEEAATQAARLPGVTRAGAVVLLHSAVTTSKVLDVNVIGVEPGGPGAPSPEQGRGIRAEGEVVADTALGLRPGSTVSVSGRDMEVVGVARDLTYYFGTPTVVMSVRDAQSLFLGGQPLVTAVVLRGRPEGEVPGLSLLTPAQVRADLARPTQSGDQTIQFINFLLWLVAAGIIGSIVYLSAIERTRDFAVMKAVGASDGALLSGLAVQAVVLSLAAAALAAGLAQVLARGFPFAVRITPGAYAALVAVALGIGLLASTAGLRRAVRVDPGLAFGGG